MFRRYYDVSPVRDSQQFNLKRIDEIPLRFLIRNITLAKIA